MTAEKSLLKGIIGANTADCAVSLIDSGGSPRATVDVHFYTMDLRFGHLRFGTLTPSRFLIPQ